ncbi:FHA domain-containing protein [Mycobacterium sp.]|uniref:ATP-binding cassette domain-containing protein n=1 Tax=Mycobacterium sp. TaxID=1785 RepID=UPI0025E49CE8|nr:FHA domain-containing protein [Mycobacterium sp.]
MSRPAPPVLTVWHNGSESTFTPGHDVIIGRDLRADVRIPDPRISRAHLILRFDQGKWVAIDNGSVNGTFVNGYRRPVIDVQDGQSINIGNAGGPLLTFEVGSRRGHGGPPPTPGPPRVGQQTMTWSTPVRQAAPAPPRPAPPAPPRPVPPPRPAPPLPPSEYPTSVQAGRPPAGPPPDEATVVNARSAPVRQDVPATEVTMLGARPAEDANFATRFVKRIAPRATPSAKPVGSVTIGRAADNDIVVPDVLASRYHATLILTPLGTEIRDTSVNGTFVNGTRVGSAILREDDVVTVGNIDLIVSGGLLVRRSDTEAATRTGGLEVRNVQYTVENGKQLLSDISLTARPGTLTAVIGGSGAGKSTLARLIAGYTTPSGGSVTFEGHDIHAEYASLRSRIGMVPQDDVVHRQLTVHQALSYAAELRLPPDTSKADRIKVVSQVLEELDLTKHADTRVDKLSGGQRKRASVALELLTGPSLLMLDEPTSGLDPALDLQVMTMLRQLADAGRVVLVVTHSLSYLDVCDQVLLVAPGGKTAYCGPPDGIGEVMGTTNWAKIFSQVGADPEEANRRFRERQEPQPPSKSAAPADLGEPVHTSVPRQISTIARRQVRLVIADRAYFVFLALLPFILGALSLTVPGTTGFRATDPHTGTPDEAAQILALLLPAAAFMGVALTIRDLVGERAIFQREQAVGLSTTAYLLAKTFVFCGFAVLQAAIVTAIVVVGKGAPSRGAVLLGHSTMAATAELFLTVAAACVASAVLGLAISSLVRSSEQIMPLFVVAVMAQLVLCGGMVPVTGRLGLDQMSWLMPARWGYAAAASTVDLRHLVPPTLLPQDQFWQHTRHFWLLDMGMLAGLALFFACFVRWKIRLRR